MATANLMPYFQGEIGNVLRLGECKRVWDERRFAAGVQTRYFDLLVIAVDEEANTVFFEGWSRAYEDNTSKKRYHGTTQVCLDGRTSVVEIQMIAAYQLPVDFDRWGYVHA